MADGSKVGKAGMDPAKRDRIVRRVAQELQDIFRNFFIKRLIGLVEVDDKFLANIYRSIFVKRL